MTKLNMLEGVLFGVFVVTTNALVVMNTGWVFLVALWNSVFVGIIPIVSMVTIVSFLAFALLEDHLGGIRRRLDGVQP